jgi:hypothetical protein
MDLSIPQGLILYTRNELTQKRIEGRWKEKKEGETRPKEKEGGRKRKRKPNQIRKKKEPELRLNLPVLMGRTV